MPLSDENGGNVDDVVNRVLPVLVPQQVSNLADARLNAPGFLALKPLLTCGETESTMTA